MTHYHNPAWTEESRFRGALDDVIIIPLGTSDPVAAGYVTNLAHPGGKITGVSSDTGPSLCGRRIALLRELLPDMSKLAVLTLRVGWPTQNNPIALRVLGSSSTSNISPFESVGIDRRL